MGVCTVKFVDGAVGIPFAFIGYVGNSFGATSAVVFKLD